MSFRSAILTHALPHIPSASFTRQALTASLTTLSKDHPDYRSAPLSDEVLDTLYGSERGAEKELVARWADEGVSVVRGPLGAVQHGNGESSSGADKGKGKVVDRIRTRLERRLDFSGDVGEHLVEAYALLASPSSTPAIPIPSLPLPLSALLSLRLPIPYLPPGATALARGASAGGILKGLLQNTGGRIPLLSVNPAGPLGYAWQIADAAILEEERGRVERGVMNEPVGAGPEWYTSRLALSLAYLSAESVLLRPYPQLPPNQVWAPGQPNPHLPLAQQTLTRNMRIYETFRSGVQSTEQGAGAAMGYLEFLGKSLAGVVRSRYW